MIPDAEPLESKRDVEPRSDVEREARALIVAGANGVLELSIKGETKRVLSTTPGRSPRWISGEGEWVDGWPDVDGVATALWVGPHHLVVGRQLIVAGHEVVELPGDLVL